MMKTTHFGSNRSYGLSKAILLYSDGQEAFATVHEPKDSPDGGPPYLDAGEPLSVGFLRDLARALGQTVQRRFFRPMSSRARQTWSFGGPSSNDASCSTANRATAER